MCRRGLIAGALAALSSNPAISLAQEIAAFRLTGLEGYASVRYLRDDFETQQFDVHSRQNLGNWREEVFVMTHSYVYHPNFVTLDVGAGPVFQQGRASADLGDTSSKDTLYNLTARATFLRDKPYRGSLFYEHLNPQISVAPGSIIDQEDTRYGFDFSMAAPVPIDIDASRFRARGSSVDTIIDNRTDQFSLRASQPIGSLGLTRFRYQYTGVDSLNGSPNLPIDATKINQQNYLLDTHLRFGAGDKYDLFNLVSLDSQKYAMSHGTMPDRDARRFLLDFRGRETERLNVFATYNYVSTDQGVSVVRLNAATAGATYAPIPELSLQFDGRAQNADGTQLAARSWSTGGTVQYHKPLGQSVLNATYALRYGQLDQQATAAQVNVYGEIVTLAGATPIALFQPRVAAGSIVVSNATRTQVFVDGLDFVVSVVGLQTRLQRLVGGNILEGQAVLVDYVYDAGGTYASTQIDQAVSVAWNWQNYVELYVRYVNVSPSLTSGTPTTPLNTVRSLLYGTRVDVPLNLPFEVTVGGLAQRENVRETISPYRRQQYEVYVQSETFFGRGNFRLAARRVNQDYDESPEQNVRLTGYAATLQTEYTYGISASASAAYERDTGRLVPTTRMLGTAGLQWRYRQVNFTAQFTRSRETQGDAFERKRTLAQVTMRRDF